MNSIPARSTVCSSPSGRDGEDRGAGAVRRSVRAGLPQGDPLAEKAKLTIADIQQAPLLLLTDGHAARACAGRLPPRAPSAGTDVTATSLHTLVEMAANGLGVTLIPDMALQAKLLKGSGAGGAAVSRRQAWPAHRPDLAQDLRTRDGVPPAGPDHQGRVSGGGEVSAMPKGRVLLLEGDRLHRAEIVAAGWKPVMRGGSGVRRPARFVRMFPECRGHPMRFCARCRAGGLAARPGRHRCRSELRRGASDRHSRAIHVEAPMRCIAPAPRRVFAGFCISRRSAPSPRRGRPMPRRSMPRKQICRAASWIGFILRPSLVFAEGSHGGTSALRGIAASPCIVPLPGGGNQRFSPIHADDLARAVALLLAPERRDGASSRPAAWRP